MLAWSCKVILTIKLKMEGCSIKLMLHDWMSDLQLSSNMLSCISTGIHNSLILSYEQADTLAWGHPDIEVPICVFVSLYTIQIHHRLICNYWEVPCLYKLAMWDWTWNWWFCNSKSHEFREFKHFCLWLFDPAKLKYNYNTSDNLVYKTKWYKEGLQQTIECKNVKSKVMAMLLICGSISKTQEELNTIISRLNES